MVHYLANCLPTPFIQNQKCYEQGNVVKQNHCSTKHLTSSNFNFSNFPAVQKQLNLGLVLVVLSPERFKYNSKYI